MAKYYHLTNIRTLLTAGFTDGQLRRFCFDRPEFRPVYDQLAQNSSKGEIIDHLLDYADRTLKIELLLEWASQENPSQYEQHHPYEAAHQKPPVHGGSPPSHPLRRLVQEKLPRLIALQQTLHDLQHQFNQGEIEPAHFNRLRNTRQEERASLLLQLQTEAKASGNRELAEQLQTAMTSDDETAWSWLIHELMNL